MKIHIFSELSHQAQGFYERLSSLGFNCEIFSYVSFIEQELLKIREKKDIFVFICDDLQSCYLKKVFNIPILIIEGNTKTNVFIRGVLHKKCNDEELKKAINETFLLWKKIH